MNDELWELLAARRNLGLRRLEAPGPDDDSLRRLLLAAAQAPDHGQLHPWRFIQIPQERRPDLGQVLVEVLAEHRPEAIPISAVYPGARLLPARVRALLEALDALHGAGRPGRR